MPDFGEVSKDKGEGRALAELMEVEDCHIGDGIDLCAKFLINHR